MNLYFNSEIAANYKSNAQKVRVMSETWLESSIFCPSCGKYALQSHSNNNPAADFFCRACAQEYELKSKKGSLGVKIVDGAYQTMVDKISKNNSPNFFFLTYCQNTLSVENLLTIPKHLFTTEVIEKRKPLSLTAKRAGWVGCNILLQEIPVAGRVFIIHNKIIRPKNQVISDWGKLFFLQNENASNKGWILDIVKCIERMGCDTFTLSDLYLFEHDLAKKHPKNKNIKPKIRQLLQVLRDQMYLKFIGRGVYKLL